MPSSKQIQIKIKQTKAKVIKLEKDLKVAQKAMTTLEGQLKKTVAAEEKADLAKKAKAAKVQAAKAKAQATKAKAKSTKSPAKKPANKK